MYFEVFSITFKLIFVCLGIGYVWINCPTNYKKLELMYFHKAIVKFIWKLDNVLLKFKIEGEKMAYKRYKSEKILSKQEKVNLMAEYIDYYNKIINEQGIEKLNVKISRKVFDNILDEIGSILNKQAIKIANEDGPVKDFLHANPLPNHMKELLPDDFRVFTLILNSLKQWVSAESAATDKFLLGHTAKQICKTAVDRCIVTGGELGEKPELHHPMRDGRPPILLSKKGHDLIEQNNCGDIDEEDDDWNVIKRIRAEKRQSWVQLREGCNAILTESMNCRTGAKSFANKVIKETGLSVTEVIDMLDERGV